MQVAHARATFVTQEAVDESLTTIVARSVLEAALQEEEPAELWFELQGEGGEDVNRLSIDLSYSDIEQLLSLSSEDEIASRRPRFRRRRSRRSRRPRLR